MKDRTTELEALREEVGQLRREVAMYRGIFEHAPVGTYVYQLEDLADDHTLRMVAANPVVEDLAGLPPTSIVGKTLDENFPGLREQGVPQAFAEVVRSGEPFEMESVYGDERVITSAFAFRAVALPRNCVAVMFENITARKQAEHALQQLNAELEQRVHERTEELRYNQMLLQTVMDTAPTAIYIKDLHGRFLLVNRRTSALLGMSPEEMQGKLDTELFPAEFAAQWRANEQRAIDAGVPISIEETVTQEDGIHTFLSIRTPIYDEAGQIYAIGGIATDITERKQQEEELRFTKTALDRAADMVLWHDMHGQIVYINESACRNLGYTHEEMLSLSVTDLDPNFTMETARELWHTVKAQGFLTLETTHRRKDGSMFPSEITINALQYGKQEYLCVFARDITERKQQEEELQLTRFTINNTIDQVHWLDMQARHAYVNSTACTSLGYTREELLALDLPAIDPKFPVERWPVIRDQLREIGNLTFESVHQRKDGSMFPVEIVANFLVFNKQEYICAFARDITERKRHEAEREALQQQIIDAQRNALRELSTPLIPISRDVVIMPLIGTIDSQRAQQVMEALLEGVAQHQASLVILDITGVAVVDTQVAQTFIQAAQAVRLLGAQVMLTGIQPQIAQTLVHLGVDLSGIITSGSLQAGIAYALNGK